MERNTRQRNAILGVITEAGRPLSTQEILVEGQAVVPSLSIATVYRTLKDLITEGWIVPVKLPGEADRYELTKLGKHYHFKCSSCSKVFDIHERIKNNNLPAPASFSDHLALEWFISLVTFDYGAKGEVSYRN